jgi:hypothetical protein
MKKALLLTLLLTSTSTMADGYHGGWVAPLITGLAVGAIISNATAPQPYYVQPAPPVYVQPPVYNHVPYGYHHEPVYDSYCGCYRTAIIMH